MLVVADASPLIILARVGMLDLVRELYGPVRVPSVVWAEAVDGKPDASDVVALRTATWIVVDIGADADPVARELEAVLDRGEAAAIALAVLRGADTLLMDERRGRREAAARGVETRGTVGVLALAKGRGFLPALRPVLDDLAGAGFRLSAALRREALAAAGEGDP